MSTARLGDRELACDPGTNLRRLERYRSGRQQGLGGVAGFGIAAVARAAASQSLEVRRELLDRLGKPFGEEA